VTTTLGCGRGRRHGSVIIFLSGFFREAFESLEIAQEDYFARSRWRFIPVRIASSDGIEQSAVQASRLPPRMDGQLDPGVTIPRDPASTNSTAGSSGDEICRGGPPPSSRQQSDVIERLTEKRQAHVWNISLGLWKGLVGVHYDFVRRLAYERFAAAIKSMCAARGGIDDLPVP
jgi:hypothetical protein